MGRSAALGPEAISVATVPIDKVLQWQIQAVCGHLLEAIADDGSRRAFSGIVRRDDDTGM
jgi:hypothetical protein